MPNFAHEKIAKTLRQLNHEPSDPETFRHWLTAGAPLDLIRHNASDSEIIIHCSGSSVFTHSLVVPNSALNPPDKGDLLSWSANPYTSIASYAYGGGREEVWIERAGHGRGSRTLNQGTDLIFGRTFEGSSHDDKDYIELNQEYAHLCEIHWRREHNAYCKYDHNGDLREVASITLDCNDKDGLTLVTFKWSELEQYLSFSNSSLVRMFDFTMFEKGTFHGWPDGPEKRVDETDQLFYRQKMSGRASYIRGIQIIGPRQDHYGIAGKFKRDEHEPSTYVEFLANDWRNQKICRISTDPSQTTNYFEAAGNNRPFELSPAFFRPEVLSKYKTDREKYTVSSRSISCRSSWFLRGYDVNEAGQVHAYICDLRRLPYTEQLHWLSYNEKPQTGISERAIVNDFRGEWHSVIHPREQLMGIARRWNDERVPWWKLREACLLERANPPLTASRDEWSEAFMDVSKLVVEGFDVAEIRKRLTAKDIRFDAAEGSIKLLERLVDGTHERNTVGRLEGLRTVQSIRSKVRGHSGGQDAAQIVHAAISDHGSFAGHFKHVLQLVVSELETVEHTFLSP